MQLEEGRNCWKRASIPRGSIFVDAQDFFQDVYENLQRARSSVYILGWEFHHRTRLLGSRPPRGAAPERLDHLINYICRRRPDLKIYILCWDFPAFFLIERESFQDWKIQRQCSDQVRFVFDSEHPIGASHHQKLVVIDDRLAYCGGLDLTANRWDSREHRPRDRRRRNPWGKAYSPLHDIQISVSGDLASALGELARERWFRATGERLSPPPNDAEAPAYSFGGLPFRDQKGALARTQPEFKDQAEVREIEIVTRELFESAREYLYLENQFFTSDSIAEQLHRAAGRPDGPEVLVLLPKTFSAPWEKNMVGILQNRVVKELSRKGDERLKILCAEDRRLDADSFIQMHSKLIVVDGKYISIGSANLTKRSMGLDTECNVILEDAAPLAGRLVSSLIAEHTGQEEAEVEKAISAGESLSRVIEEMNRRSPHKKLLPYKVKGEASSIQEMASELQIVDSERPLLAEQIADRLVFGGKRRRFLLGKRMLWAYLLIFLLAALVGGMLTQERFWSLRSAEELGRILADLRATRWTPLWVLGVYGAGAFLFLPINVLFVVTAAIFPLGEAAAYMFGGALLNSMVSFYAGRWLGRAALEKIFPRSVKAVSQFLSKSPTVAVTLIHLFPIAPFTVDNLALGALKIGVRPFLLGTLLGLLPGGLAILFFEKSLAAFVSSPSWKTLAIFYSLLLGLFLLFYYLKNRFSVFHERAKPQNSEL